MCECECVGCELRAEDSYRDTCMVLCACTRAFVCPDRCMRFKCCTEDVCRAMVPPRDMSAHMFTCLSTPLSAHIGMHMCTHIRAHFFLHVSPCFYPHVRAHVYTYVYTHVYPHVCTHAYTHVYTQVLVTPAAACGHLYTNVYPHVHAHVCTHFYTHVYTQVLVTTAARAVNSTLQSMPVIGTTHAWVACLLAHMLR